MQLSPLNEQQDVAFLPIKMMAVSEIKIMCYSRCDGIKNSVKTDGFVLMCIAIYWLSSVDSYHSSLMERLYEPMEVK